MSAPASQPTPTPTRPAGTSLIGFRAPWRRAQAQRSPSSAKPEKDLLTRLREAGL